MSFHLKINSWSGASMEDVIPRLAKVFRMSGDDAGKVMRQILQDQPWQFHRTVSNDQAHQVDSYLKSLGFEVELVPIASPNDPLSSTATPPSLEESREQIHSMDDSPRKSWFGWFSKKTKADSLAPMKRKTVAVKSLESIEPIRPLTQSEKRMLITNVEYLPNKEIVSHHGLVSGNTVRAKHAGRDLMAGLKNIFGGELKGYTELLTESREEAISRMMAQATQLGANAILNVRFSTSSVAAGAAELYVYGTAVTVR